MPDIHTIRVFYAIRGIEVASEEVQVLGDTDVIATCAVRDIEKAKKFYGGTLGLTSLPSQDAGTNKATAATWAVNDLEATVQALKAKGVRFEHYDLPGTERTGDIHGSGKTKAAWFKDPDGNILAVVSG